MENMEACEHCGNLFPQDELIIVGDENWCKVCCDEDSFVCDDCGKRFPLQMENDARDSHGHHVQICDDCLENWRWCESCGSYRPYENVQYIENTAEDICQNCIDASDNYHQCEGCDSYLYTGYEDGSFHVRHGNYYCDSCWEKMCDPIHPYNYKPSPEFHTMPWDNINTTLHYGLEIEIEAGGDRADVAEMLEGKLDSLFYCKYDNSIDNDGYGVEIVTHPFSISWMAQHWDEFLGITQKLTKTGARSHYTDNCGLHIHVSKLRGWDADKARTLRLVIAILHDECVAIARRNSNGYCKCESVNNILVLDDDDVLYNDDRYLSVNYQNRSTVEFRMFKGTLNAKTILASIEFVTALMELTYNEKFQSILMRPDDKGEPEWMSAGELVNWDVHDKLWKQLLTHLRERDFQNAMGYIATRVHMD